MFGYITINPKMLEEEQALRYRSYYCGVCRSLTENYGRAGQLVLSNDMTFVAVLLSSLYEPSAEEHDFRCALHPVKGRHYLNSAAIEFAADMNLLLAWYKCKDDMQDNPGLKSSAETAFLQKAADKVRAKWPEKDRRVDELLKKNSELEKLGSTDLDALCRLSGAMFAETLVWKEDAFAPALRRLGMCLGSFIYLMDAYDDYREDAKRGRFNPLKGIREQEDYEALMLDLLTMTAADAEAAMELLPLEQDLDLL